MHDMQGAAHVSAYVTHGVFPNATWKRFSPQGNGSSADGFKFFWITDSCANTANSLQNQAPFEVLLSTICAFILSFPSTFRRNHNVNASSMIRRPFVPVLQVLALAEPIAAALQI